MQQPFPVPDDYDDDGEQPSEPPAPRLTPEQVAEQSALSVFPGAAELDSDQWWQPPEPSEDGDDQPFESFDSSDPPLQVPTPPPPAAEEPAAVASDWATPQTDEAPPEAPAPEVAASTAPRQLFNAPEPESLTAQENLYTPEPEAVAPPPPPQRPVSPDYSDEIPRSVLSLPLLSGREQREAAGASQREAIMAQAGALPDPSPAADGQRAVAMQGGAIPTNAVGPKKRGFTRKIRLSLIVIVLTLVTLWAGAVASGQGGDVERGAFALAPDVLERWISDQVSSFSDSAPATTDSTVTDNSPGTVDSASEQALLGRIAHTGGSGVPVRSTCVPEARTPRTLAEGAPVTVIARGVGDCSGWNVVRAGAAVSWVESAYVEPVAAP